MEDRERDHWIRIKKNITCTWSKVSEEELERTRGNISAISHLILKKYKVTKQDIAGQLVEIMHASTGDTETRGNYGI